MIRCFRSRVVFGELTEEEKTYLEGNVAVSPEDEVVLPKSKAFEIED